MTHIKKSSLAISKFPKTNVTRGAQTSVHLRRLENLSMQFSVILLQVGQPKLQLLTRTLNWNAPLRGGTLGHRSA